MSNCGDPPSTNAVIGNTVAVATIIDNDAPAGTAVVTINDFFVDEFGKEASFVVTLDRPSTGFVSLNCATQDGTAVAVSDYTSTSGSVNFAPGETAKTVKVTLPNDTASESSEAFNLVLSAMAGATTLDPVGTAIIAENDAAQVSTSTISVDAIVVGESQTYADLLAPLDSPNSGTITVSYQTDAGTANNLDFVGQSGFSTFAAGEMVKTVRVTLRNNTEPEATAGQRLGIEPRRLRHYLMAACRPSGRASQRRCRHLRRHREPQRLRVRRQHDRQQRPRDWRLGRGPTDLWRVQRHRRLQHLVGEGRRRHYLGRHRGRRAGSGGAIFPGSMPTRACRRAGFVGTRGGPHLLRRIFRPSGRSLLRQRGPSALRQ